MSPMGILKFDFDGSFVKSINKGGIKGVIRNRANRFFGY